MTDPSVPELGSDRLILRRHREADLDAAAAMWGDAGVVRYIGGRPFTREEVWHRILRYLGHWALRPFGYWAIEERASGRFVGEIGLADWKREKILVERPEAGWVLAPAAQGRGYAKEAIGLMLEWADATAIGATSCIIGGGNSASIRLAERFGFARTDALEAEIAIYERPGGAELPRWLPAEPGPGEPWRMRWLDAPTRR